jgi:HD-GYP domain-containing protein (c-di-GMP phosphodiesterase class II)
MEFIDGKEWIPVRKSNLKYYDDVELYYRNPAGRIALYKPAGMSFTDSALDAKPYLGELYIRPEDKLRALREAQRGFSTTLTSQIVNATPEGIAQIKNDLTLIVDETLSEPRSGSLQVLPDFVASIVDAYSGQPTIIKHLARISHTDYTTAIHSINVMALTVGYCFYTERSMEDTRALGLAALLHDVGKVDVDSEILTAPRRLTEAEFEEMARHPRAGAEILQPYNGELAAAVEGALQHHLKLDGSGYPADMDGPISETGRIIAIIDAYEALTNDDRPYRSAMRPLAALKIIKDDTDAGKYDRKVFSEFAYSLTDFRASKSRPKTLSAGVEKKSVERITRGLEKTDDQPSA